MGTRSLAEILLEQEYYFIAALLSSQRVYLRYPCQRSTLSPLHSSNVRMVCHPKGWSSITMRSAVHAVLRQSLPEKGLQKGWYARLLIVLDPLQSIDDLVARINTERYYRKGTVTPSTRECCPLTKLSLLLSGSGSAPRGYIPQRASRPICAVSLQVFHWECPPAGRSP